MAVHLAFAAVVANAQESEAEQSIEAAAKEAAEESVDLSIGHIELAEELEVSTEITLDHQNIVQQNKLEAETGDAAQDELEPEASESSYQETISVAGGGSSSVGAELVNLDKEVSPLLNIDFELRFTDRLKDRKHTFNSRTGIAFSVDYSFLAQQASSSSTEKSAGSDVFRVFGNWMALGDLLGTNGNLVFKYEHRAAIWGRQTPRDLGFATGSALSTANYKENGWGWTDLYWKQVLGGGKYVFLLGHMDPGDWADQHSLLNAWTDLLSDAFYNNPAEAIPKRATSLVGRMVFGDGWYSAFGVHDSNGKDNHLDFKQVFETPELFTWVEIGRAPNDFSGIGETTHLHYWHQDTRVAAGVAESWGLTASRSKEHDNGYTTVMRIGYSEGDAAQMRRFVGLAVSKKIRFSDRLLLGIGWGSPPDKSLGSQTVLEALYRLQLTNHVVVSPDLQITFDPSFDTTKSVVYVFGLRFRMTF